MPKALLEAKRGVTLIMLDKNVQSGFVLLITVIVMVAVLLIIVSSTAAVAWQQRQAVLEQEYASIAIGHAESCIQTAALRLSMNENVNNGEIITGLPLGGSCTLVSFAPQGNNFLVTSEAVHHGAVATYQGLVSGITFKISQVRLVKN